MVIRRKRNSRKSSAATVSPSPFQTPPPGSPDSPAARKRTPESTSGRKAAGRTSPISNVQLNNGKPIVSVSDLRDLVAFRLRDLKSNLIDRSHSEIVDDLNSSRCRLHKRLKIQTQASQQVMDETQKEYKKMMELFSDSREAMRDSYEEFIADVQSTSSRVCKATIPDLSKSFERMIGDLQSRYGISST